MFAKHYIHTNEELDTLRQILVESEYIAFDFETTDLHHKRMSLLCCSFMSDKLEEPICVPFKNFPECTTLEFSRFDLSEFMHSVFEHNALYMAHNIEFEAKILRYFWGIILENKFCSMIASWYIDENRPKKLKILGPKLLGMDMKYFKDIDTDNLDDLAEYCNADALACYKLSEIFAPQLEDEGMADLFYELEMPYIDVLVDMTLTGIEVDSDYLRRMAEFLTEKQATVEATIYKEFGNFNIGSGPQLCERLYGVKYRRKKIDGKMKVIFERLDGDYPDIPFWTKPKKRRNVAGEWVQAEPVPSTDDKALKALDTPIAKAITEYRETTKLLTTYALGYLSWVINGKIYPHFNHTGTVTGRLCVHPDTLIEAPRNLEAYPNGVPLHMFKEGDLVYSFDEDRELCIRKVKWVGPTKVKPTLVIHTDKGLPLTVSREHLVRKWNGVWVHAKDLKIGDRLLCMPKRGFDGGYAYFFPHSKNRGNGSQGGGKVKEHRFVALNGGQRHTNYLVHHKDENKANNHPALLEEAVRTGYGKTGRKLSPETLRKYEQKLRQNHVVTKIEEGPETQLWDLEIEDTHTFIGNDVALHNSSSDPNMQNIPSHPTDDWFMREVFYAPEGYKLVIADESQLELRVLAHYCKDPKMLEAFYSGDDIHQKIASQFLEKPFEEITPEERRFAKTLNFGIIYGMGPGKLGEALGIPTKKATKLIKKYYATFEYINKMKRRLVKQMRSSGYITTICGRKRRIPELLSDDEDDIARAERQTVNSKIQGSAGDIVKVAMLRIYDAFKEEQLDAHIVLQIHDELVCIAKEEHAVRAAEIVQHWMEHPLSKELEVPLIAIPKICTKWSEGKD
jgi:DNA polymerase I-like protein with 3'-5' exonuclease and polymerase domains